MADAKISGLPAATSLVGSELFEVVQSGVNKQATPSIIEVNSLAATSPLSVAKGGTGGTTAATARAGISAAELGTNADITAITGLLTPLSVAQGGTGGADATTARANLGLLSMSIQAASAVSITGGAITGITDLAIADGGTGSSTAVAAVVALGALQGLTRTAVKTAATYTAGVQEMIPVDTTSNSVTITLPTAPADKSVVNIKHIIQGGTNIITVNCGGSDVFNKAGGSATGTISLSGQVMWFQYQNSTAIWQTIAADIPLPALDIRFQPKLTSLTDGVIGITIDGGGSAITTGIKGYIEVPFTCTVTGWTILGDLSGSIVVDVQKDTYANFPTITTSIAGSELPTITTAFKGQDLTLSTWTTSLTKGDILEFTVNSCTTITRVNLAIRVTKA